MLDRLLAGIFEYVPDFRLVVLMEDHTGSPVYLSAGFDRRTGVYSLLVGGIIECGYSKGPRERPWRFYGVILEASVLWIGIQLPLDSSPQLGTKIRIYTCGNVLGRTS